jgi:uncharacterized GH25 family protein
VLTVILLSVVAFSHDYWLEPESFFIPVGGEVNVRMYMGQHLTSEEERPYKANATVRFELFSGDSREDLSKLAKDEAPVARLAPPNPGNYLLAMERKAQTITLVADKFTEYLKEEGLDAIIKDRERLGESETNGNERYNRFLKTLLQVGDKHDDTFKRVVGHRLEIIPQHNPYKLKPGSSLKLQVLFEGQPLIDATVYADNRSNGTVQTQKLQTSHAGTIVVKLDRPGVWLVRMVHMQRCIKCGDINWESFWSAFSFGLKE